MSPETFSQISSGLWLGLLHAGWISLAAAAGASLLLRACPNLSSTWRRQILVFAIVAVLLGPPALVALQRSDYFRNDSAQTNQVSVDSDVQDRDLPAEIGKPADAVHVAVVPASPVAWMSRLRNGAVEIIWQSKRLGLIVWLGCVCFGAATLALGQLGVQWLLRNSIPANAEIVHRADLIAGSMRLRKTPKIRLHATVEQPCLCGVFQPFIVLPETWAVSASEETLNAVLAHELAHAKRRDLVWNLADRLVVSLIYFHPALRQITSNLRREREIAADSLAVHSTGNRLALARAIESLARNTVQRRLLAPMTIGMASSGDDPALLSRIQEILGMKPSRPRFPKWTVAALSIAAVIANLTVAVGWAQDDSPAAAQPASEPPQGLKINAEGVMSLVNWLTADGRDVPDPKTGLSYVGVGSVRVKQPEPIAARPAPRVAIRTFPGEDKQIAFEVRFVEIEPDTWRDAAKGHLRPLPFEGGVGRWMIDSEASVKELMKMTQAQPTSLVTQAPKVTTFQAQQAVISIGAMEADMKTLKNGARLELEGTYTKNGTKLNFGLHEILEAAPDANNKPTERIETRLTQIIELPEGSTLLLSLGRRTETLKRGRVTRERLVFVTPRRIILEDEAPPKLRLNFVPIPATAQR